MADFERKNVAALTPNRKNLITNNCMGAISIILLDEAARAELFALEPKLDTFFSLAIGTAEDEKSKGNDDDDDDDEEQQEKMPDGEMDNHVQVLDYPATS